MMADQHANHDAEVRRRIEQWTAAIQAKDLDNVMSIYSEDIVAFDVEAPLQYTGFDAKRRRWADTLALYEHVLSYDVRHLTITADGNLAYGRSLTRLTGILVGGKENGFWLRWTSCFRKIVGAWLFVHDHISAPIDPNTGTACLI